MIYWIERFVCTLKNIFQEAIFLVILTPFAREFEMAKARFGDRHEIVQTGVGPRNIIKTLLSLSELIPFHKHDLMLFGFAGSNTLPVGTEVFVTESHMHQFNAEYSDTPGKLNKPKVEGVPSLGVPCYTSSDFVTETNVSEPAIFDMELGFLTELFPNITCWRIVSDNLDSVAFNNFVRNSKE